MKLSITIIDDEIIYTKQLICLLKKWGGANNIEISWRQFQRAEDFEDSSYDENELFFLDIDLVTSNGIDIARKLRNDGFTGYIIFLTAFREYVFDGYHVQALDYLLKPIDAEKLYKSLQPVIRDMESTCYIYSTKNETVKIPYNKITAFTSYRHYVDIKTQIPLNGTSEDSICYRHKITLKALEQTLPKEFIRCHRTIIINMNKVLRLTCTEITLSDKSVYPVSESYLKNVKNAFFELMG